MGHPAKKAVAARAFKGERLGLFQAAELEGLGYLSSPDSIWFHLKPQVADVELQDLVSALVCLPDHSLLSPPLSILSYDYFFVLIHFKSMYFGSLQEFTVMCCLGSPMMPGLGHFEQYQDCLKLWDLWRWAECILHYEMVISLWWQELEVMSWKRCVSVSRWRRVGWWWLVSIHLTSARITSVTNPRSCLWEILSSLLFGLRWCTLSACSNKERREGVEHSPQSLHASWLWM